MNTEIAPKFRKTKTDKWAVMAPVPTLEKALAAGGTVQVLKKSGDWSEFHIVSLGKPFDVDGVQMCYGYGTDDSDDNAGGGSSGGAQQPTSSAPQQNPARHTQTQETQPTSSFIQAPPPPDDSEPLPEYRGEDSYDEGF